MSNSNTFFQAFISNILTYFVVTAMTISECAMQKKRSKKMVEYVNKRSYTKDGDINIV